VSWAKFKALKIGRTAIISEGCVQQEDKTMRFVWLLAGCLALAPAFAETGGIESLRQTGKAFSTVAKKVAPSVVFIQVEGPAESEPAARDDWPFHDDLFRRFFGDEFAGLSKTADAAQAAPGDQPGFGLRVCPTAAR
jgi:serine protease Do